MGGFQGSLDYAGEVVADRVQVHRVLQPGGELGDGLVGVVAGPRPVRASCCLGPWFLTGVSALASGIQPYLSFMAGILSVFS